MHLLAIECWDFDLSSEDRLRVSDRHMTDQVLLVTFKEMMLFDVNLDVQVAARPAVEPRLSFTSQAKLHAVIETGRNSNFQFDLFGIASRAAAITALIANNLPFAATGGTSCLDSEEALRLNDLAVSLTVIARRR